MFDLGDDAIYVAQSNFLSALARLYAAAMRCPLETVTGHHVRMMANHVVGKPPPSHFRAVLSQTGKVLRTGFDWPVQSKGAALE